MSLLNNLSPKANIDPIAEKGENVPGYCGGGLAVYFLKDKVARIDKPVPEDSRHEDDTCTPCLFPSDCKHLLRLRLLRR